MTKTGPKPPDFATVRQAAEKIHGKANYATIKAVQRLIAQGKDGPFPGAYKLPGGPNMPYQIPIHEIEAHIKKASR
jgi:hypothetical protein